MEGVNGMTSKLKTNKLQCNNCKDIIESKYTHDFKYCKCGAIAVDGGLSYLRRVGTIYNYTDLSEYENDSPN